ncbi:MAG: sensor histidine kinase [Bacillota bacterium]|nr:sensor histidine kinase [Bacillota bacterium]
MKNKSLFTDFMADSTGFIAVYFINTAVLLLFFYLFYEKAELLYPFALSLFIFSISMVLRWLKYVAFNQDIGMTAENIKYKVSCTSREQKRVVNAVEKLHSAYGNELSNIKINNRKQRRMISQFIHSLKAPVTVIDMAVSDILEADDMADAGDSSASTVRKESEKMLSILDNLLNLVRLEEFEIDYAAEPVNLQDSLTNIINEMKMNFIYGKVIPKVQCNYAEPVVYTDEKWNKIMLQQFISNAIKYSLAEEELKTVFFIIEKVDENIMLTIKDEGIGIPEYDLDRVTEAFFTGDNGRKVKSSSGIGLYISKEISEKLNHPIDIISKQGDGTEIKITYLSKT